MPMNTMSIKEYAIAHKLSIYNVVKMTKNGTLQTETKKVDGKDEVFIIDEGSPNEQSTLLKKHAEDQIEDYKKAYEQLKVKYDELKLKYEDLQKKIGA